MSHSISTYLKSMLSEKESWEKAMEEQAANENIPIMEPESMDFVKQLIRMKRPDTVLEIGTAIGYSALQMHDAYPGANIVTIERDKHRYRQARELIHARQKADWIHVIHGDALEILPELHDNAFDVVLIDAAKAKYKQFFEQSMSLLNKNALVISDNVLFKGYVTQTANANKRYGKLAQKMQAYNAWLKEQSGFDTSIIPIGDGIAISLKK